ncbi:MAG: hypothetical protein D6809_04810 [Gammaproteobacteria bacterium]|nr:MAG: hypothetical protein D6809_04810 [Gammaproteobacteria bacterium]
MAGLAALAARPARAEPPGAWGFSPYLGAHAPRLRLLQEGEMRAPFEGDATLVDQASGANVVEPFRFDIPLDGLPPGRTVGVRFQWWVAPRHALLLGAGTWAASAATAADGTFPLQGHFEAVRATRKADLSYNEFFFGWRYGGRQGEGPEDGGGRGPRWHLDLTFRELFDVSYREEFVFLFLSGPPKSFRRAIVTDARATGLLLGQVAVGADWPLGRRFALGLDAGYTVAASEISLGEGSVRTDFQATDNLSLQLPLIRGEDGRMLYKDPQVEDPETHKLVYRPLKLGFDGWKATVRAVIYY